MGAKHFEPGDRVAHSARVAYQHGGKSIARTNSILSNDPDAFTGTVVSAANEVETAWRVKVDDGAAGGRCAGEEREFSADSLVKVED